MITNSLQQHSMKTFDIIIRVFSRNTANVASINDTHYIRKTVAANSCLDV